jgi:hypothetical protein
MSVLLQPLDTSAPYVSIVVDGVVHKYDTRDFIFVFILDDEQETRVGTEALLQVLVDGGERELVPEVSGTCSQCVFLSYAEQWRLKRAIENELSAQWRTLRFSRQITEVIPYLPMRKMEVLQVVRLQCFKLEEWGRVHGWWATLHVSREVR